MNFKKMKNDTYKDWKLLPDKIDFTLESLDNSWTFGCGGRSLRDDQWYISCIKSDLSAEIYVLPKCISYILSSVLESGREEKLREIHKILQL